MKYAPKYPVYIISKGRYDTCYTAHFMLKDKLPFYLVIEPQEEKLYKEKIPEANYLILPFSNLGQGSIPARNFCWEHSKANGHARHWIFDDNIRSIRAYIDHKRIPINSNKALFICEYFINRYSNIGIAGLNYSMFVVPTAKMKAYRLNVHVYSCLCIDNNLPFRWRGKYNEDTDLCLQVLTTKRLCTVAFNIFCTEKIATMTTKGGNTEELYADDGRLKMAQALQQQWPHIVTIIKRYQRAQHCVNWLRFKTPLRFRGNLKQADLVCPLQTLNIVPVAKKTAHGKH